MEILLYDVGKVLYKYCTSTFPISTLNIMFMYIMWWYVYEYHLCNCFEEINSIQKSSSTVRRKQNKLKCSIQSSSALLQTKLVSSSIGLRCEFLARSRCLQMCKK